LLIEGLLIGPHFHRVARHLWLHVHFTSHSSYVWQVMSPDVYWYSLIFIYSLSHLFLFKTMKEKHLVVTIISWMLERALRNKVSLMYNEKLFTSNHYKFMNKTVKTTLTIISKLNLYVENNFITDLDVLTIQNDYNVIWPHIFKSYETQEVSRLLIMKNIDQIQPDECWIMRFNSRKWHWNLIKARCFKPVSNDWRIHIWNNDNNIDSLDWHYSSWLNHTKQQDHSHYHSYC